MVGSGAPEAAGQPCCSSNGGCRACTACTYWKRVGHQATCLGVVVLLVVVLLLLLASTTAVPHLLHLLHCTVAVLPQVRGNSSNR